MDFTAAPLSYPINAADSLSFPHDNWSHSDKEWSIHNFGRKLTPDQLSAKPGRNDNNSFYSTAQDDGPEVQHRFSSFSPSMQMNEAHIRHGDMSIFSSSFPALFHEKLSLSEREIFGRSFEVPTLNDNGEGGSQGIIESLEELESHTIGTLLPDNEEELLAGVTDNFGFSMYFNNAEDAEDLDLFSFGGGMELESDGQDNFSTYTNSQHAGDALEGHPAQSGGIVSVAGEHPYGEHPSRTLFVRNINSSVEDSELRSLFEQYGALRTLYTACKHRGFVMISYYDIRAARSAMRALQNKPLRRRKLDIHFSIPKDNPSDKDINQGTLVVFNLDSSVSNDELRKIFGVYGEVKEIRETPHKHHHKFIEFYDIRAAEAALRALNRSDIAGKRIKLEPSRPGGARRSLMQQLSQELEQEELRPYQQQGQSPVNNSPPVHTPQWLSSNKFQDTGALRIFQRTGSNPNGSSRKPVNGLTSEQLGQTNQVEETSLHGPSSYGSQSRVSYQYPQSLPEFGTSVTSFGRYSQTPNSLISKARNEMELGRLQRAISNAPRSVSLFNHHPSGLAAPLASSPQQSRMVPHANMLVSKEQSIWKSSSPYTQHAHNSPPVIWTDNLTRPYNHGSQVQLPTHALPGQLVYPSPHQHHRSAPGEPILMSKQYSYYGDFSDSSPLLGTSLPGANGLAPRHVVGHRGIHGGINFRNGVTLNRNGDSFSSSSSLAMIAPQQRARMFSNSGPPLLVSSSTNSLNERGRSRRGDAASLQADNKKQYQLDLDRILCGEDPRTTLMIKNIPNKYTSKMLLTAIDEHHHGTYDFIYLPIDFKNKCNVGYSFINMIDPSRIVPFYQAFNGKKWEKFNSDKVASLAYARIQGKAALVAHFQNSSLMNEDKRCRPILFHSKGPNIGDQEPFPMGANVRVRPIKDSNSIGGAQIGSPSSNSSSKEDSVPEAGDMVGGALHFTLEKDDEVSI